MITEELYEVRRDSPYHWSTEPGVMWVASADFKAYRDPVGRPLEEHEEALEIVGEFRSDGPEG